ncbi:uncharacterized protein LOC142934010 [Anarhichas minor]|uniref:uncharacterized protein LOC142934010 n=1 Tax=Anarhichas minor TaxID=65739 RepID=UPI003F73F5C5
MYISEQKVKTAGEAAALADDYVLTHRSSGGDPRAYGFAGRESGPARYFSGRSGGNFRSEQRADRGVRTSDDSCHFCHGVGHWKRDCALRKSQNRYNGAQVKPAALAAPVSKLVNSDNVSNLTSLTEKPDLTSFLPFITKGHVSLVGTDRKVPVTILRDTGAFDSFILASALPFSAETDTGFFIPVLGMGMSVFQVPIHKLVLHSDLFEGEVAMGVRPALPIDGVMLVLGNDVAGARVWPDDPAQPVLVPVPLGSKGPDENEKQYPDVFQACAVTRAMTAAGREWEAESELASEQRADSTLSELFQSVLPENQAGGYFIQNEIVSRYQ